MKALKKKPKLRSTDSSHFPYFHCFNDFSSQIFEPISSADWIMGTFLIKQKKIYSENYTDVLKLLLKHSSVFWNKNEKIICFQCFQFQIVNFSVTYLSFWSQKLNSYSYNVSTPWSLSPDSSLNSPRSQEHRPLLSPWFDVQFPQVSVLLFIILLLSYFYFFLPTNSVPFVVTSSS